MIPRCCSCKRVLCFQLDRDLRLRFDFIDKLEELFISPCVCFFVVWFQSVQVFAVTSSTIAARLPFSNPPAMKRFFSGGSFCRHKIQNGSDRKSRRFLLFCGVGIYFPHCFGTGVEGLWILTSNEAFSKPLHVRTFSCFNRRIPVLVEDNMNFSAVGEWCGNGFKVFQCEFAKGTTPRWFQYRNYSHGIDEMNGVSWERLESWAKINFGFNKSSQGTIVCLPQAPSW